MLKVTIPDKEFYDDGKQEFVYSKGQTIVLEHSLVSLSKWESRWKKPFITKSEKTIEETIDYIKCMTITQNVKDSVYKNLSNENIDEIKAYIYDPMTATTISKVNKGYNNEIITSEIIYFWMTALNIPYEYQKWHLNRLLTLIAVSNIKNSPPKKMSKQELLNRNRKLNEERKKSLHTEG